MLCYPSFLMKWPVLFVRLRSLLFSSPFKGNNTVNFDISLKMECFGNTSHLSIAIMLHCKKMSVELYTVG